MKEQKICDAPNCENKVRAKGYCPKHYKQFKAYGHLVPDKERNREVGNYKENDKCIVDGCNNKPKAHWYCDKHYGQYKTKGYIYKSNKEMNDMIIHDGYAEIILINAKYEEVARTIMDIDDIELISTYRWHLDSKGYVRNSFNHSMHRMLIDAPNGMDIDHINRNPLDNRKANLRICTRSQNSINKTVTKANTSGCKGVNWQKNLKKWESRIWINGETIRLGYFRNIEEAIAARKAAETQYYGEFVPRVAEASND